MAGLEEAVNFIECSDANEYIARLNTEADEESEQKAIEEARENKLESEIKLDIDFQESNSLIFQKKDVLLHRFFATSCDNPHRVMVN